MVRRLRGACTLLFVLIALLPGNGGLAQTMREEGQIVGPEQVQRALSSQRCWSTPQPETVEEALKVAENPPAGKRMRPAREGGERDVLLLSDGELKAAYGAGLLMGWGETGNRPQFVAVTAVGISVLIAPFAFIGPAGDQMIANIFNCNTNSLVGMSERAASELNSGVLEAIAREHESGRRLLVALPGSAARAEVVWDLGRLAASRHASAAALFRKILLAAADQHTFVDPTDAPAAAGQVVERNFTFRKPGAGEAFLFPHEIAQISGGDTRYYLIHNGSVFPDESADYIRAYATGGDPQTRELLPAYEIIRHSAATGSRFRFASIKLRLWPAPEAQFDMAYVKAVFMHTYRQGRMDKEWKSKFPGLPRPLVMQ